LETATRILEMYKFDAPKLVALTADAQGVNGDYYINKGFDEYLGKPFKSDELLKILQKISNNKSIPV